MYLSLPLVWFAEREKGRRFGIDKCMHGVQAFLRLLPTYERGDI